MIDTPTNDTAAAKLDAGDGKPLDWRPLARLAERMPPDLLRQLVDAIRLRAEMEPFADDEWTEAKAGDELVFAVEEFFRSLAESVTREVVRSHLSRRMNDRLNLKDEENAVWEDAILCNKDARFEVAAWLLSRKWNDSAIAAQVGMCLSTAHRWRYLAEMKARVAEIDKGRATLRATLEMMIRQPQGEITPHNRLEAIDRLAALDKVIMPRPDLGTPSEGNDRERREYYGSLTCYLPERPAKGAKSE